MKIKFKILSTALFFIFALSFYLLYSQDVFASETNGTIVSGGNNGYAWSNQTGWVNFGTTNGAIAITDAGITGYAWNNNYGWINMSPANGGITIAANGALSGYAWSSGLGWINFAGVSINSSGKFVGTASGANIGTLTFDCTNCSVTTDFRAQNFRTVAPAPTTVVSGGGGGGGGGGIQYVSGPGGQLVPAHISAFNVPLEIDNDLQSGTLTQAFAGGLSVGVDIPRGSIGGRIIINSSAIAVDTSTVTTATRVISSALFDVTATDGNGNPVHSFVPPIRIALQVPEELQGRSDIGVYFFDEGNEWWERVPNAQFDGNIARFYVDHLTLFGIFSDSTLPNILTPFFAQSSQSTPSAGVRITPEEEIGAFADGEVPAELTESLPAQLFDINFEIENTKIAGLKDLVARVLFTSFGRVPTLVDLTFDILNENGEKVYSSKDDITVQTQAVLTKRFADAEEILEIGKYTLLVTTVYNTDVVDEFRQDFEIAGEGAIKKPFWRSLWFWGISTIFLMIIFIIIFFVVMKKIKDDEEKRRQYKNNLLKNGQ